MKNRWSLIQFLFLTLIIASDVKTFAGDFGAGNGGDAVVCRDPGTQAIKSVQMLDLYEARVMRNLSPTEFPAGTPRAEIIKTVFASLSEYDSTATRQFTERALTLENEIAALEQSPTAATRWVWMTDEQLVDIPDSFHLTYPQGCQVEQLIIQKQDLLPGDHKFIFSRPLWNALGTVNQAAAIIHEVLYEYAIRSFNAENSVGVRYMNGLLMSGGFTSGDEFTSAMVNAKILTHEYVGPFGQDGRALVGSCMVSRYYIPYIGDISAPIGNWLTVGRITKRKRVKIGKHKGEIRMISNKGLASYNFFNQDHTNEKLNALYLDFLLNTKKFECFSIPLPPIK